MTLKFDMLSSGFKSTQCKERKKKFWVWSSDFLHDLGQISTQLSDFVFWPSQFLKTLFLSDVVISWNYIIVRKPVKGVWQINRNSWGWIATKIPWNSIGTTPDQGRLLYWCHIPTMHVRREFSPELTKSQAVSSQTSTDKILRLFLFFHSFLSTDCTCSFLLSAQHFPHTYRIKVIVKDLQVKTINKKESVSNSKVSHIFLLFAKCETQAQPLNMGLIESWLLKQSQEMVSEKVLCLEEIGFFRLEKQYGISLVINCWLSTNIKLLPIKIICEHFNKKGRVNRGFYTRHDLVLFPLCQISDRLTGDLVKLLIEDN